MEAKRDWGFAGDYVEAMWMMLQQDKPDDYVISTGESHSVREFVERAADCVGIKINWEGEGINENGYDLSGKVIVKIDGGLFRPVEVNNLLGDSTKARQELRWKPKVTFERLVELMVKSDLDLLRRLYL